MIAGTLEIQMMTNLAQLAKDMSTAKSTVTGAMQGIESAVSVAKSALQALGIGLSVNYFVNLVKGTIDAMDHLHDLSKTTSIAVEDLAGLSLAAKQSGGDLDSIAASIGKLSKNIGLDPEKFRALGISAKDPVEQLKQLADIFVALEDPAQRAAVMAAALGRAWQGAAPLLAEGGQRIGEMVDTGKRLSGVTEEATKQAKQFHDQMAELEVTLNATKVSLVSKMLPALNDIATAMRQAAQDGGVLLAIWVAMGGAMAHLTGLTGDKGPTASGKIAKPIADGMDNAAIAAIIASDRAKKFLRDDYAERVAIIKIGGVAYAEQIKTNNKLAELAMQEGGIVNQRTREDLLNTQSTNNADQIADAMLRQQAIRNLSRQGAQTPEKVKAAAEAGAEIEKLNQRLVDNETLTQAAIRAERTKTLQAQQDQYNLWATGKEQEGLLIAQSFDSQATIENRAYAEKLAALEVYLAANKDSNINAAQLRENLESQHQANLGNMLAEGMEVRRKFAAMNDTQQLNFALDSMVQMTQGAAAHNKEMFEINKVAAMANATVKGIQAVIDAYAWGDEWGGPVAGAAMAAIAAAAVAVQLSALSSTQYGGGSGVAASVSGSAGGAAPTFQTNAQTSASAQTDLAAQASSHTTVIEFNAKDDDVLSGKFVRAILAKLDEVTRDGGRVIISGSAGGAG